MTDDLTPDPVADPAEPDTLLASRDVPGWVTHALSLTGVTLAEGYQLPLGYELYETGVFFVKLGGADGAVRTPTQVTDRPMLVSDRYQDETGEVTVRLAWRDVGGWRHLDVAREVILDSRKILRLTAKSFPVASDNAAQVVRYLRMAESSVMDTVPTTRVSRHLGWTVPGVEFVAGPTWGHVIPPRSTEGFVSTFRPSGTMRGWLEATAWLEAHRSAQLAIVASLAAPLLGPLGAPSFVVDFAGPTSTGKTTALRIAASVWGDPADGKMIQTWDATPAGLIPIARVLRGLPLCMDDSKNTPNEDLPGQIIYEISTGQGSLRGTPDGGLRDVASWQTVLLSTGEVPVTDIGRQHGGIQGRVVSLWGPPIATGVMSAVNVNTMTTALSYHFGHAGPAFVGWLLARGEWGQLQARWRELTTVLRYGVSSPVAGRRCDVIALMWMVAELAAEAGLIRSVPEESFWRKLIGECDERDDKALEALRAVLSWAAANDAKFFGSPTQSAFEPHGGWLGRRMAGRYIAPGVSQLKEVLEKLGFDYSAIVRQWSDNGWTQVNRGRQTCVVRLDAARTMCAVKLLATRVPADVWADVRDE